MIPSLLLVEYMLNTLCVFVFVCARPCAYTCAGIAIMSVLRCSLNIGVELQRNELLQRSSSQKDHTICLSAEVVTQSIWPQAEICSGLTKC